MPIRVTPYPVAEEHVGLHLCKTGDASGEGTLIFIDMIVEFGMSINRLYKCFNLD
jgi:hypothetical protein